MAATVRMRAGYAPASKGVKNNASGMGKADASLVIGIRAPNAPSHDIYG